MGDIQSETMDDIRSERRVLPFPEEIRLGIYHHLFSKQYCAIKMIPERYRGHPRFMNRPIEVSPGLVILRVSKTTSSEASALLFNESIFVLRLDFTTPCLCDELSRNAVARIKTVCFEVSAESLGLTSMQARFYAGTGGEAQEELTTQRTIGLFTGTTCLRKIMRIKFMGCVGKWHLCMPHALLQAMKDLGGFQKLVVEFEFSRKKDMETVAWISSERFQDVFLNKTFEPVYGPAIQYALQDVDKYTCYMDFFPRQHLEARLVDSKGGEDAGGGGALER